jgi:hypothetical protein
MSTNKNSVSGSWLGNYYYESSAQPFGFEAVFVDMNGRVEGSILDDGKLGEARVIGSFANPYLKFTKKYGNAALNIVNYEGAVSDEGKKLSGTWHINAESKGYWLAWRQDEEEIPDLETGDELERERRREKVMVAPLKQSQG